MIEFGPQPTAHDPACPEAGSGKPITMITAVQQHPYAFAHHCTRTRMSRTVVLVPAKDATHPYEASTIWPANASRELCVQCRGTHPGEQSLSGSHIGAYYGEPEN